MRRIIQNIFAERCFATKFIAIVCVLSDTTKEPTVVKITSMYNMVEVISEIDIIVGRINYKCKFNTSFRLFDNKYNLYCSSSSEGVYNKFQCIYR